MKNMNYLALPVLMVCLTPSALAQNAFSNKGNVFSSSIKLPSLQHSKEVDDVLNLDIKALGAKRNTQSPLIKKAADKEKLQENVDAVAGMYQDKAGITALIPSLRVDDSKQDIGEFTLLGRIPSDCVKYLDIKIVTAKSRIDKSEFAGGWSFAWNGDPASKEACAESAKKCADNGTCKSLSTLDNTKLKVDESSLGEVKKELSLGVFSYNKGVDENDPKYFNGEVLFDGVKYKTAAMIAADAEAKRLDDEKKADEKAEKDLSKFNADLATCESGGAFNQSLLDLATELKVATKITQEQYDHVLDLQKAEDQKKENAKKLAEEINVEKALQVTIRDAKFEEMPKVAGLVVDFANSYADKAEAMGNLFYNTLAKKSEAAIQESADVDASSISDLYNIDVAALSILAGNNNFSKAFNNKITKNLANAKKAVVKLAYDSGDTSSLDRLMKKNDIILTNCRKAAAGLMKISPQICSQAQADQQEYQGWVLAARQEAQKKAYDEQMQRQQLAMQMGMGQQGMYGMNPMMGMMNPMMMNGMYGMNGMMNPMMGMYGMNPMMSGMYGMNPMMGMYGMNNMYGMNGMNGGMGLSFNAGLGMNNGMYGMNPMMGMGNMYGMNNMYGANPYSNIGFGSSYNSYGQGMPYGMGFNH